MKASVESNPQNSPGWYQRFFAWMMHKFNAADASTIKLEGCHCASSFAELKQFLFADLQGSVLEIGPGTGPNLSYYSSDIHWVGVEPNPFMYPYLKQEAERLGLDIDIQSGTAEQLEVDDNSMDAVISTLVLCSVGDLAGTLREVLRVLKPGGRFLFLGTCCCSSRNLVTTSSAGDSAPLESDWRWLPSRP